MDEDNEPRRVGGPIAVGENLENLSIAELRERLVALQAEIERVNEAISQKSSSMSAAADIFKTAR